VPDAHLSRTELIEWRDSGAGDRVRIVSHLAVCAACRAVAAAVERQRPLDSDIGTPRFEPADFVERGYRAGTSAPVGGMTHRWWWPAAAAALIALAVVPLWLARSTDPLSTMRGDATAIRLVRPVATAVSAGELVFEWSGVATGDRVRLNVVQLDRSGQPLIEREVTGTRYVPTPEERQRFLAGQSVHWYVERLGGSGGETSPAAEFRVR
jgi:hypothetical protein